MANKIASLLFFLFLTQYFIASTLGQRGTLDYSWQQDAVVWGGNLTYHETRDELERGRVRVHWFETGRETIIWDGHLSISFTSFSPSGQTVAFIEHFFEEDVDPSRATFYDRRTGDDGREILRHHYENQVLRLISTEGEIIQSIDQVRAYDWSPDGDAVTYITGHYLEGGVGFSGRELWLYTLGTSEPVKLYTRDGLLEVEWADFDGRIYARTTGTEFVTIDPTDKSVEPSKYRGVRFSPDGRYYFSAGYEGGLGLGLFYRDNNENITQMSSYLSSKRWSPSSWWLNDDTIVFAGALYNCTTDTTRPVEGLVLGFDPRTSELVVWRQRQLVKIPWVQ